MVFYGTIVFLFYNIMLILFHYFFINFFHSFYIKMVVLLAPRHNYVVIHTIGLCLADNTRREPEAVCYVIQNSHVNFVRFFTQTRNLLVRVRAIIEKTGCHFMAQNNYCNNRLVRVF